MIRILHMADLHLDKEFFPENPRFSALRKKEQQALFANIMMYVRDRNVDVLLISGDLLDTPVPCEETGRLLLREFENTPDTEIFIAPGQNDPYRPGSFYASAEFPQNVHIFKSERLTQFDIERLGLTVYGYAFCHRKLSRNPLPVMPPVDAARCNLICAYAGLTAEEGVPCFTEEQIAHTGADYLALGHDHNGCELQKAGSVYYAAPGSPEGLSFEEKGEHGVRIAAMDKSSGELLFKSKSVRFSRRRFEKVSLDATGMEDCRPLSAMLFDAMKQLGTDSDTILQAEITGEVPITFRLNEEAFSKNAEKLCYLALQDHTVMVCPEENGEEDAEKNFRSVFAKIVKNSTNDKIFCSKVLKCGYAELEGK